MDVDLLNAYIHYDDVKIFRGLTISRGQRPDSYGWNFTEPGKYSVKLGFKIETLFSDRMHKTITFGPNIQLLLAFHGN